MEINKEEITELRELYQACLEEARTIPPDILARGHNKPIKNRADLQFVADDYRQIASSLFIQYNKNHQKKGQGKYTGPATDKQQKHIAEMAMLGAKNETIINNFLNVNNRKSAEELTKSEASSLIDLLHAENPRR